MVYKVIARKFRPQTFEEVIGQKHVIQTLKNAIRDGRIAHAFLFAGERGVGKTSIARILAKALNCYDGPAVNPCGICPACMEITDGSCIDVNEIDGASNTGVDDIRTLRENIRFLPSRDKYKIYIIDEVHMLSNSAFNALLKTLEEPPEHIIFMFATTEPKKIPDTIISRCLRFDLKRIPAKEIMEHLENIARQENVSISKRGLSLISRESEGSMRDAQTIFERAISYCGGEIDDASLEELLGHIDMQYIYRIMDAVIEEDPQGCIAGLNEVYESGADMELFYFSFMEALRNLIMIKALKDPLKIVDLAEEDLNKLESISAEISLDALHRCFRLWFSSENEIVKSSRPKIALELSLLEMLHIKRSIPIDDILSRIDCLKKQVDDSGHVYSSISPSLKKQVVQSPAHGKQSPQKNIEPFLAFVRKKHPPIFSILDQGNIGMVNDSVLKIEFSAGSFFIDKINEPETEKKLTNLCTEFFQKEMKLSITETHAKKKPENTNVEPAKNKKQDHTFDNPVIQKIIKVFDGRIVSIGTDL